MRLERLEIGIERVARPEPAEARPGDEHARASSEIADDALDVGLALEKWHVDTPDRPAIGRHDDKRPPERDRRLPVGLKFEALLGLPSVEGDPEIRRSSGLHGTGGSELPGKRRERHAPLEADASEIAGPSERRPARLRVARTEERAHHREVREHACEVTG